jgi:hypothetical protein
MSVNYCTTTSLETILIGVNADTATTKLFKKCIAWSENEINKYLSKRYDISSFVDTSSSVPPLVADLCEQLAESFFYSRNSRGGKESLSRSKQLRNEVLDNLKMIQKYEVDLLDVDGGVITDFSQTSYRVLSNTDTYTETFNEDSPLDWKVDNDKLTDIASDRT